MGVEKLDEPAAAYVWEIVCYRRGRRGSLCRHGTVSRLGQYASAGAFFPGKTPFPHGWPFPPELFLTILALANLSQAT